VSAFAGLLLALVAIPKTEAVKVFYVRPSRVLVSLRATNLVNDLTMTADDRAGILNISGPQEEVEGAGLYVKLFDVPPWSIKLRLLIDSPADRVRRKIVSEVSGNGTWSTEDEYLGVSFKIAARRNDDGSLTLVIDSRFQNVRELSTVRTFPNKPVWIRPGYIAFTDQEKRNPSVKIERRSETADELTVPMVCLEASPVESKTWGEPNEFAPSEGLTWPWQVAR